MITKKTEYTGLDLFRMIAALLVITIHTSPLLSVNEQADFILTRIIARLAVPFFIMASGFFLCSRCVVDSQRLKAFVKKTALIYAVSIAIYLPLNIYNGYFGIEPLLPNIIKDLLFDGTLYHLWYLPAVIMGAVLSQYFIKHFSYKLSLIITTALYVIGLLGDSYYGFIEKSTIIKGFYELLFQVSDYTRNGIFIAPLFFVLGSMVAGKRKALSLKANICGFMICFSLMLIEALSLHKIGVQRHDSMYVFLPISTYFLFNALLYYKGKRLKSLRSLSLIIYMIHPMMIVVIRLCAKLLHMERLFIQNSMVHFLLVSAASIIFALLAEALYEKLLLHRAKEASGTDRSYLEINMDNLEHNANVLRAAMPGDCELMAVVKGSAYGHGAKEIASRLNRIGVNAFAVATIDEGIELRSCGIAGEILILGYTAPSRSKELKKYNLTQSLIDYKYAAALSDQAYDIKAHIKLDTGMHRLGFDASDADSVEAVFAMKHIHITGVYTHLGASDSLAEEDVSFTKNQIEIFYSLMNELKARGISLPKLHIQSSYGLLNYPELKCDYVRAGIALYGVLSAPCDRTKLQLDLKPVLSLKSRVVLLRSVKAGEGVGYNRAFVAKKDSTIAILPIGYADGYPRSLSFSKSYVLINGQRAPVVGKICMDQMAVDVTDIMGVVPGTIATLIGCDGNETIAAPLLAEQAQSISNELLCRMGRRLKIV